MVYLSARTLKTHQSRAGRHRQQGCRRRLNARTLVFRESGGGARNCRTGNRRAQGRIALRRGRRGTVWFGVHLEKIDPQTGVGTLTIESPQPHDIVNNMVPLFEQRPVAEEAGKYLGEFKVTVDGTAKTVKIAPNLPLTDAAQWVG